MSQKIIYTAYFVKDIESLVKTIGAKHPVIYAHHSTISFKPRDLAGIEVGKESKIKIVGRVYDDKCDAVIVEIPKKSQNKYPHITISCKEETPPFYANILLEEAYKNNTMELFKEPIEINVIEGYFDGEKDVIEL